MTWKFSLRKGNEGQAQEARRVDVAPPRPPPGSPEAQEMMRHRRHLFLNNSIRTTKYNAFNYFPKCLYEQFRRLANQYFLLVAIISLTPVSPVTPFTNVMPLVFVLGVSLIKEYFEDRKRRKKDREINGHLVQVLGRDGWQPTPWRDVMVGDIVCVRNNEQFPADLVLLSTGVPEGAAYVETSNLDRETNLKLVKAQDDTWAYDSPEKLSALEGSYVECDPPNNSLYTFTGNLVLKREAGQHTVPLGPANVVLRGCMLRNTPHIHGLVIYTGHESKIMLNSSAPPSKRSHLERNLDKLVAVMFSILFSMCFIGAVVLGVWMQQHGKQHWYLEFNSPYDDPTTAKVWNVDKPVTVALLNFLTLITLYSTLIPISLYVSIEIIKFTQATFLISMDPHMFHKESGTPALARTSNLNEELGQVEYVFSDKTGTLTQNLMEFFKCSIAGVKYGAGMTEVQRAMTARKSGRTLADVMSSEPPRRPPRERGMNFEDARVMDGGWRRQPSAGVIEEFFRALALCHTVVPEGGQEFSNIKYQAASPDDVALCLAAKHAGWFFQRRTTASLTLQVAASVMSAGGGRGEETYQLLATLEFNSTRKRMSVIVREPWSGNIKLYCKGADNVILQRLGKNARATQYKGQTVEHLEEFAHEGLRTLCIGVRSLSESEFQSWFARFTQAKQSLTEREAKIEAVAEEIEHSLELLGATAIEDKLQVGVPACIERLMRANLKIWVLTGDKIETAINIAFACSLLTDDQEQHIVQSTTALVKAAEKEAAEMAEKEGRAHVSAIRAAEVARQLREIQESMRASPKQPFALVIDGAALESALGDDLKLTLLDVGQRCRAVVCCRVSPLQKALVTRLVRDNAGKVTLSIGDGANDVSMIQAAHIGVGISGNEGMQAVMASDFAIAQFRFLTDLLLVHGSQMYHRVSRVVGYFFYKNFAFTITQFIYGAYQVYSGQTIYDDWFTTTFNLFFTSVPVLVVGVFDQEVLKHTARTVPQLYAFSQKNANFDLVTLGGWLANGLLHGVLCFFLPFYSLSESTTAVDRHGRQLDMYATGIMCYTIIITTVNLRLLIQTTHQTLWHQVAIYGSIAIWVAFILAYSAFTPNFLSKFNSSHATVYLVFYQLLVTPRFWLGTAACTVMCLLVDFLFLLLRRTLRPWDWQVVQEYQTRHKTLWVPRWAVYGGPKNEDTV